MRPVSVFSLIFAIVITAASASAELPTRKYLPTGVAMDVAVAAVAACREKSQSVAAAVVDAAGDVLASVRDDRARGPTAELARNWARQGAIQPPPARNVRPPMRVPGLDNPNLDEARRRAAEDAMARAEDMQRRNEAQQRRQFGQPILVGGVLIGVVAVAGAQEPDSDLACAAAGIEKNADKLK